MFWNGCLASLASLDWPFIRWLVYMSFTNSVYWVLCVWILSISDGLDARAAEIVSCGSLYLSASPVFLLLWALLMSPLIYWLAGKMRAFLEDHEQFLPWPHGQVLSTIVLFQLIDKRNLLFLVHYLISCY